MFDFKRRLYLKLIIRKDTRYPPLTIRFGSYTSTSMQSRDDGRMAHLHARVCLSGRRSLTRRCYSGTQAPSPQSLPIVFRMGSSKLLRLGCSSHHSIWLTRLKVRNFSNVEVTNSQVASGVWFGYCAVSIARTLSAGLSTGRDRDHQ